MKAAREVPVVPLNFATIDKKNELYDQSSLLRAWAFIAARDAAITIYHFRTTLYSVIHNAKQLPKLGIDITILEAAKQNLEANFPDASSLRSAISHEADNTFTVEKRNKHALEREDGLLLMISGILVGNVFQYTNHGEVVSLTIASSTLSTLTAIQEQLYSAFPSPRPRFAPQA